MLNFNYFPTRKDFMKVRKIDEYMKMPYNFIIQPINDESGYYYYARVIEFDGCQSTGETFEEAYKNIQEAMEGWIEAKLEGGFEIPKPLKKEKFSGKFVIRIPKSLHYRLYVEAKEEDVSLNQYILYKLSK